MTTTGFHVPPVHPLHGSGQPRSASVGLQPAGAPSTSETERETTSTGLLALIAMDLHDLAIQRLFAAGLSLDKLRHHIPAGPDQARFDGAVSDLDATIKEMRDLIALVQRGAAGHRWSLVSSIDEVVTAAAAGLGFPPQLRVVGVGGADIPEEVSRDVVAVLTEALSNIVRHAQASTVFVEVTATPTEVRLEVTDDGRGMGRIQRRSGLANLAVRAARHGGTFEILSRPNTGTTLTWTAVISR